MRLALSLLFIVHGLSHLPGFLVPWGLVASAEMPYTTKVLGGAADFGSVGIRLVGILWLVATVAFVVAGIAVLVSDGAWRTLALAAGGGIAFSHGPRLAPVAHRAGSQSGAPGVSRLGAKTRVVSGSSSLSAP